MAGAALPAAWRVEPPGTGLVDAIGPAERLRGRISLPDTGLGATLQYWTDTQRYVWTPLFGSYWTRWQLRQEATGFWSSVGVSVMTAYDGRAHSDPSVTYHGTWSTATTSAAMGGGWRNSPFPSRSLEIAVTGVRDLYIAHARRPLGSYGIVTINGGTGLANELPLVSGQRRLDCYSPIDLYNEYTHVASGLNPNATYTVWLQPSGVVGAGGGAVVYFSGWASPAEGPRHNALLNSEFPVRRLSQSAGVWEYAYSVKPEGATSQAFTGAGHGHEVIESVEWEDGEGNPLVVDAENLRAGADRIVLRNSGTSRHPQTGETDIADFVCEHRWDSRGMEIWHRHEWLVDAVSTSAYAAMFTLDRSVTHGQVAGDWGVAYDLSENDNAPHGYQRSRAAVLWDPSSPWAAMLYAPDALGANYFLAPDAGIWIQDRELLPGYEDDPLQDRNKIYLQRGGHLVRPLAILEGEVWESTARYLIGYRETLQLPVGGTPIVVIPPDPGPDPDPEPEPDLPTLLAPIVEEDGSITIPFSGTVVPAGLTLEREDAEDPDVWTEIAETEGGEATYSDRFTVPVGHQEFYTQGSYSVFAYFWGAGSYTEGVDYDAEWAVDPEAFPAGTSLAWRSPDGSPTGVWGYHHLDHGNYDDSAQEAPINPAPISDLAALSMAFEWRYTGTPNFGLLTELWLTSQAVPSGTVSASPYLEYEIGFFLHQTAAGYDWHDSGALVGIWGDYTVRSHAHDTATAFITFAPTAETDVLSGAIDWKAALDWLVTEGAITDDLWVNGLAFGIEPQGDSDAGGVWSVDSFSVTMGVGA